MALTENYIPVYGGLVGSDKTLVDSIVSQAGGVLSVAGALTATGIAELGDQVKLSRSGYTGFPGSHVFAVFNMLTPAGGVLEIYGETTETTWDCPAINVDGFLHNAPGSQQAAVNINGSTAAGAIGATDFVFTVTNNYAGTAPLLTVKGNGALVTPGIITAGSGPTAITNAAGNLLSSALTGNLPALNGSALTSLNASNLSSGTVATARLGTGTADNTTYLRGDGTWAAPAGGGGGITNSAGANVIPLSDGTNLGASLLNQGTNTIQQRNGTNAQSFYVFNTYTDASNYEKSGFEFIGGELYIINRKAGTGAARDINIASTEGISLAVGASYTDVLIFDANGTTMNTRSTTQFGWSSSSTLAAPADAGLAREAAGIIRVTNGSTGGGALQFVELAGDPTAPATNNAILYTKDVGGKTALMVRFPTGSVQQLSIEP